MIAFLKLIRLPNLLIIAFTQYMIRFCLIQPILKLSGFQLQMSEWEFALLALATLLISAAGYIINDYFDVRIDNINKPGQLVIDKGVKRRVAMAAHAVMSILGVAIGVFISWKSHILLSGSTLFVLSVIGLWYYSTSFKYQFLSGNILVSLLTAMAPFMVALFEVPRMITTYNEQLVAQNSKFGFTSATTILLWTGAYGLFALLLSLIREIIKDMEDAEGDSEYGCRTIPIVLGTKKAKWVAAFLILAAIPGCAFAQYFLHEQLQEKYSTLYFSLLIQLPLIYILYRTLRARQKKDFHFASIMVKMVMLSGICFLFLFRYLISR
ncbi:MAG TPA: geranylgeranylglycerol-phosphate geranylgeranyltransferase [Bacteroidia bacterium]